MEDSKLTSEEYKALERAVNKNYSKTPKSIMKPKETPEVKTAKRIRLNFANNISYLDWSEMMDDSHPHIQEQYTAEVMEMYHQERLNQSLPSEKEIEKSVQPPLNGDNSYMAGYLDGAQYIIELLTKGK